MRVVLTLLPRQSVVFGVLGRVTYCSKADRESLLPRLFLFQERR